MTLLQENGLPVLLLVVVLVFMLRYPVLARFTGVEQLGVHELAVLLASASPPLLIDVRSKVEFDSGHIANAVLLPVAEFDSHLEELRERSASRSVAVVCLSGGRSVKGAVLLKQAGFAKVFNVVGGVASWKAQGYPLL